jgi:hypothetical protein
MIHFRHQPLLLIAALLLIALALMLRLYVGRRRFYRRNGAGLQTFRSYTQSIVITILENLALFIATVCVICAMILVVVYYLG